MRNFFFEKMFERQKIARLIKSNYQKLVKNLITMIRSYQPNVIKGFLRRCNYNNKSIELKSIGNQKKHEYIQGAGLRFPLTRFSKVETNFLIFLP